MSLEDPVPLLRQMSRHPVSPALLAHLSDWLAMRGIPPRVAGLHLAAEIGGPGGPGVLFAARIDTAGGRAATAAAACALLDLAIARLAGRVVFSISGDEKSEVPEADCAIVGAPTGLSVARIAATGMPPVLVASLRATDEPRTTKAPDGLLLPPLPEVPTVAIGPGTAEGGTPENEVRRAVEIYAKALAGTLEMIAG